MLSCRPPFWPQWPSTHQVGRDCSKHESRAGRPLTVQGSREPGSPAHGSPAHGRAKPWACPWPTSPGGLCGDHSCSHHWARSFGVVQPSAMADILRARFGFTRRALLPCAAAPSTPRGGTPWRGLRERRWLTACRVLAYCDGSDRPKTWPQPASTFCANRGDGRWQGTTSPVVTVSSRRSCGAAQSGGVVRCTIVLGSPRAGRGRAEGGLAVRLAGLRLVLGGSGRCRPDLVA